MDRRRIRKYLHMLESSSPSYVLMAGIDACIHMLRERREELFGPYVEMLKRTRNELGSLKYLRLVESDAMEPSKLVISCAGSRLSSRELYRKLLDDYHLQPEMRAGGYVLLMTSVGDTEEGMERLVNALFSIDREAEERQKAKDAVWEGQMECPGAGGFPRQELVYAPGEAEDLREKDPSGIRKVSWKDCVGETAMEYAYLYPPGCPMIVPGERVSQETADMLQWYQEQGFAVEGLKEDSWIEVWKHG